MAVLLREPGRAEGRGVDEPAQAHPGGHEGRGGLVRWWPSEDFGRWAAFLKGGRSPI